MYLKNLEQHNVFIPNRVVPLLEITGKPNRKGLENAIVSNGKIVNVVSKSYGHITNEDLFGEAEERIKNLGLEYSRRTINRNDQTFAMDLIITDPKYYALVDEKDKILPMLRFTNSYDGKDRTSGNFGFFREVCGNGLHISEHKVEFTVRRTRGNTKLLIPKMEQLFNKFLDNEFYKIKTTFQKMAATPIDDLPTFVEAVLDHTALFRYDRSDTNPEPSKKSERIIELIELESLALGTHANHWIGFNAFNYMLHNETKKSFSKQHAFDKQVFQTVEQLC